ncbi:hypothetical protein D3C71_2021290 [compost metagenome]
MDTFSDGVQLRATGYDCSRIAGLNHRIDNDAMVFVIARVNLIEGNLESGPHLEQEYQSCLGILYSAR